MKSIFVTIHLTDEEFELIDSRRKRERHPSIKKMVIDFVKRYLAVSEPPRYCQCENPKMHNQECAVYQEQINADCGCTSVQKINGHAETCHFAVPRI